MPQVLDLLSRQTYTTKEIYDDGEYITVKIDNTLTPAELSEKIILNNSIKDASALGSEGITALQAVAAQRVYPNSTGWYALYDSNTNKINLSYHSYLEKKYNAFSPVFAALIKPFEHTKENGPFTDLLLMQNQHGQTALHSYFLNFKKWAPIQPVFNRILRLTTKQKKDIMMITDHGGKNILHVLASQEIISFTYLEGFDDEDLNDAFIAQDNSGRTPLHYLFGREQIENPDIKFISKKLHGSKEIYKEKIILTTDNTGKNILHYALAQKNHPDVKEKMVLALSFFNHEIEPGSDLEDEKSLTEQQRSIFFKALTTIDASRSTPFQYACLHAHDETIKLIFQSLTRDQQKVLVCQNKNKALHLACRYGTKAMIDKFVDVFEPKELYILFKKEGPTLRSLVRKNHNLNFNNFEKTINAKIGWFQTYDYLKERQKEQTSWWLRWFRPMADLNKRTDDFINRLKFTGPIMPSLYDSSFDDGFSKRYSAKIRCLNTDEKQQNDLKSMIQSDITDPLNYKIAASLNSKCVLTDMMEFLKKLKTAEDTSVCFWNNHFNKYMMDFMICLRAIQQGGKAPSYALDENSPYQKFRNGLDFVDQSQVEGFLKQTNRQTNAKDSVTRLINQNFPPSNNPERRLEKT